MQLLEILILISEVLPKIPSIDNSTIAPVTTSAQTIARLEERQESLKQNMPLFIAFSEHFMQLFIGLFNASVNSQIRLTVVEFVCKSVHYIDYKDTSCLSNLSQLISEILALRDSTFVDATQETVKNYFKDARRAGFLGATHGCIYLIDGIFERNYGELITQFTREGISVLIYE
jgi:ribosomal protein S18